MFNPANETHISLHIDDLEHDLQVLEFHGREAISQPYRFEVELISERADLELKDFLERRAFLAYSPDGRGIHGLIQRFEQAESGKRLTRYRLSLVPHLAYLALRTNQRIFQHLSVPQIISQVLKEHGIGENAHRFVLGPTVYPAREYCVQYDESDLHFIQRLCEEEGLHYHFQHHNDHHELLFGDDQSIFAQLPGSTPYRPDSGMNAHEPAIKHLTLNLQTRTARVTRRDYDFLQPRLLMEAAHKTEQDEQAPPLPDLEDYDYPGRFTERTRGKHLAKRALERHRADYQQLTGDSDQRALLSGHLLRLSEHPRTDWNDLWLLIEVEHQGKQPQVLEEAVTSQTTREDGFVQGYRNRFIATPWDVPYRPPLAHPKPRVLGSQSAVVTGPAGEEIHCDEHGRIKVQFHWDREGQADEHTSCWLRVASGWAGDLYGALVIPRIGMEVLVSFLEGDPDQPLVTGCLYHAEHQVPYGLPANKTRSVFKTLSSPGGGGYNELRIEDQKGAEQIYIHAQRDWDENIENDQKIRVGHERHDTVEANSYTELKAQEHHSVVAPRKVEVKAQDHLTVATEQHIQLGTAQLTKAGREIHLKAGQKMVIEAGVELTLSAGGSFIKLDASGITLVGPQARLNAGGAPGKGSGIGIKPPLLPIPVDSDKAGHLLQQAQPGSTQNPAHQESLEYRFDIRLQDVPGDEGFPLAYTPWHIEQGDEGAVLLEGETDSDGRVLLDGAQQQALSQAYRRAPQSLWLTYAGQRIGLRIHLERQDWDQDRHALAALDFIDCLDERHACTALLEKDRSQFDCRLSGDLYTHLQSKG